jgi:hypothetical protein
MIILTLDHRLIIKLHPNNKQVRVVNLIVISTLKQILLLQINKKMKYIQYFNSIKIIPDPISDKYKYSAPYTNPRTEPAK